MMLEAASTPEMSVNFYQTTPRNIPEDSHLRLCQAYLKKNKVNGTQFSSNSWYFKISATLATI
jgi:hypothetical protein